jgi:hypothetical protein
MNSHITSRRPWRLAAVAVLLAASSSLFAGSTIRITNSSNQPWCLRVSEEPGNPILAHGPKDSAPIELGPGNKLVYYIQPGESCTLQFKTVGEQPVRKDVGLVDKNGAEKGALRLESRPDPSLAARAGSACHSTASALTQVPDVITQDGDSAVTIIGSCWN